MDNLNILKSHFIFIFIFCFLSGIAQEVNFSSQDISVNAFVDGTLLVPSSVEKPKLAILIAGSGPTDRNGNQKFLKNNNLKKLAESLSNQGIATFRYDKRVVKQIITGNFDKNTMFDDFVKDAESVIEYFEKSDAYSKIYVIGHSQGSLVGMLAGKDRIDGFISIAGAGQSIDNVIMEQVQKTAPQYIEDTKRVFDILKSGKTTSDYPPALSSLFNRDIQLFMMNWMQYDPKEIIKLLDMPIMLINGTKDLQVSINEATLLKEAADHADLKIVDKMNHVMFIIDGDDLENAKSYNESFRPISSDLVESVIEFIQT